MSTIAEIGFCPNAMILSFNHLGLSVFFTPLIRQLPKDKRPWLFSANGIRKAKLAARLSVFVQMKTYIVILRLFQRKMA